MPLSFSELLIICCVVSRCVSSWPNCIAENTSMVRDWSYSEITSYHTCRHTHTSRTMIWTMSFCSKCQRNDIIPCSCSSLTAIRRCTTCGSEVAIASHFWTTSYSCETCATQTRNNKMWCHYSCDPWWHHQKVCWPYSGFQRLRRPPCALLFRSSFPERSETQDLWVGGAVLRCLHSLE